MSFSQWALLSSLFRSCCKLRARSHWHGRDILGVLKREAQPPPETGGKGRVTGQEVTFLTWDPSCPGKLSTKPASPCLREAV